MKKTASNSSPDAAERLAEAGIYSDVPEITRRIAEALPALDAAGYLMEDARPIPYGSRITFRHGETSFSINLYFSRKKGFSAVADKKAPATAAAVCRILTGEAEAHPVSSRKREQRLTCWIGCDEAGKGDYLGPLVAAAFRADIGIVESLRDMGVQDSKRLSDKQCRAVARRIYGAFRDRIGITELPPGTYNRLYESFKSQGKSLNHLLAWAHTKAMEAVLNRSVQAVIIDQFAARHIILDAFRTRVKVIQRHRAEDNVAVAAASILARARYLYRLEKLSEELGIRLVSGAGRKTDETAAEILRINGPDGLRRAAKLHFKNTSKLSGLSSQQ